jgi:hypothetical protein
MNKHTQCCLYNVECYNEDRGLKRGLEGSGHDLFEKISNHLLGGTEGNNEVPQPDYSVAFICLFE